MKKELPITFSEVHNHVQHDAEIAIELYVELCQKRIYAAEKHAELNRELQKLNGLSASYLDAAKNLKQHMKWNQMPVVLDEKNTRTLRMNIEAVEVTHIHFQKPKSDV